MTPLVRFPWMPLEFEDGHPMERYQAIIDEAAGCVRRAGFEFREAADLPEYWVSQVLVRASDPRVGEALRAAVDATGFLYYREVSRAFRDRFEGELVKRGLSSRELLRGHDLETSRTKPWAAIETGVKRE